MAIKGRRSTPEERLRAVQLLKEGNEAELVARMFGVSRAIVFRWQQKYDAGGPAALETKRTPGPASRLSPTQMSQLYAMVTGCDPRQLQSDLGLWTRKIIRDLIRREFGVKSSEVQVGRLLKKMGLSAQRPLYRAYQRDPERVEEWKKVIYPKIRKLAADEGASIFFEDEADLRTDHHAGTTSVSLRADPGRGKDRGKEIDKHGVGDISARRNALPRPGGHHERRQVYRFPEGAPFQRRGRDLPHC